MKNEEVKFEDWSRGSNTQITEVTEEIKSSKFFQEKFSETKGWIDGFESPTKSIGSPQGSSLWNFQTEYKDIALIKVR